MTFTIQNRLGLARHAKPHHNHAELKITSEKGIPGHKSWQASMTRDLQADDKLTVY